MSGSPFKAADVEHFMDTSAIMLQEIGNLSERSLYSTKIGLCHGATFHFLITRPYTTILVMVKNVKDSLLKGKKRKKKMGKV